MEPKIRQVAGSEIRGQFDGMRAANVLTVVREESRWGLRIARTPRTAKVNNIVPTRN